MIDNETQNTNSTKNVFKDIFERIDKISIEIYEIQIIKGCRGNKHLLF